MRRSGWWARRCASTPDAQTASKSALDEGAHLLGLAVERVVVAGRERVRAEHDPALHLRPEALAPRRTVVREHVAVPPRAAEPDAVVAREVGARLGRGDDVVRRQAVVGVRERDLLDGGTGGLEQRRPPRGCAPPCPRSIPATKYSRGEPQAEPAQPRGRLVVRGREREEPVRDGDGRGRGVAVVAAGHRVEELRPRRGRRGRSDRPGRARTRRRRSRTDSPGRTWASCPTTPQSEAGWRMEPPVSVPSATGAWNAATAAAEPPDEPPGTRSRSHGLDVGP